MGTIGHELCERVRGSVNATTKQEHPSPYPVTRPRHTGKYNAT